MRANHITVRGCTFRRNRVGISIGTRDCHNVIDSCTVEDNAGAGVFARATPSPTEVHSCRIENSAIRGNAAEEGRGQVEIVSDAHDLVFVNNDIQGHSQTSKAGIYLEPTVRGVYLGDNRISDCDPEVEAEAASLAAAEPAIECGYGTASSSAFRHLPGLAGAV